MLCLPGSHDLLNPYKAPPSDTTLESNDDLIAYPNPTNGKTTIRFVASSDDQATLDVYSVTGTHIATIFNGNISEGTENTINFRCFLIIFRNIFHAPQHWQRIKIGKLIIMDK